MAEGENEDPDKGRTVPWSRFEKMQEKLTTMTGERDEAKRELAISKSENGDIGAVREQLTVEKNAHKATKLAAVEAEALADAGITDKDNKWLARERFKALPDSERKRFGSLADYLKHEDGAKADTLLAKLFEKGDDDAGGGDAGGTGDEKKETKKQPGNKGVQRELPAPGEMTRERVQEIADKAFDKHTGVVIDQTAFDEYKAAIHRL